MNVLLVDDQEIDRELVKHSLFASGGKFDITETSDPHDGINWIEKEKFDVILMDYQMPQMTGVDMLLKLKHQEKVQQSAIIVISHSNDENVMLECINAGAQDFLLKGEINSLQLMRCIRQSKKRFELEAQLYNSYKQVKSLAEQDQLTGLYNRRHFEESLNSLLSSRRGLKGKIAVMLLDLDNFKLINDSFGHAIGDKLLVQLANRVKNRFREGNLIARLGGDEFAFVFTGIEHIQDTISIANRLLDLFEQSYFIDKRTIYCKASIGIAINPSNNKRVDELLKYADIAMYRAKNQGRNQACIFEDNMECDFYRAFQIENELRRAVEQNEFELHFQPIYDANTLTPISYEALIRWPAGKVTQNPEEFIPIAEQTRMIEKIGRWTLSQGVQQLAKWRESHNEKCTLALNLSPLQIHDLNIGNFIEDLLTEYNVPPESITLEITETALLKNNASTLETLTSITKIGCKLALDDFGTGYSSISNLVNFPIQIVKFDKSLIDGAVSDEKFLAVLTGLANMFDKMGITTVAEGVETIQQVNMCQTLNIQRLQGYYFCRPLSAINVCKEGSSNKIA